MAQTNYTPISLYYSTTASAVPLAANLVPGELAINTADGKLYYEDSSGVVQVLATKSTGSIGGSNTQVQFNNSGSLGGSSGLTWDGSFLTTSSIKNSALTSGRITYAGASGLLSDSANLTYNGTTVFANALVSIGTATGSAQLYLTNATAGRTATQIISVAGGLIVDFNGGGSNYIDGANTIFRTFAGSEIGRFTSTSLYTASGINVGIGTSSPAQSLQIGSTSKASDSIVYAASASGAYKTGFVYEGSGGSFGFIGYNKTGSTYLGIPDSTVGFSQGGGSNPMVFATNATERIRIDSSGQLLVNQISSSLGATSYIQSSANLASEVCAAFKDTGTTYGSSSNYIYFLNSSGSVAGGIQHTASTVVVYNSTSDKRLKENIVDAPNALDKVLNIPVRSYDWKEDKHHVDYGFIAQELEKVYVEPVSVGSNDEKQNPWGVDYGRLTPLLVKAIQEQQALIESLTTRLIALENK
jgi:hypothetical protein